MKKIKAIPYFNAIIFLFVFFNSCVMEPRATIAIVKNNKNFQLIVATDRFRAMPDSFLYDGTLRYVNIPKDSSQNIILPVILNAESDTDKASLFIFNNDSVDNYRYRKQIKGIVKASFIKKIVIQLNKVKEPIDTIYIK